MLERDAAKLLVEDLTEELALARTQITRLEEKLESSEKQNAWLEAEMAEYVDGGCDEHLLFFFIFILLYLCHYFCFLFIFPKPRLKKTLDKMLSLREKDASLIKELRVSFFFLVCPKGFFWLKISLSLSLSHTHTHTKSSCKKKKCRIVLPSWNFN